MATVAALEAAVAGIPTGVTSTIEEEPEDLSTPRSTSRPPSAARSRPASAASDKPMPVFAPRPVRLPPVIYRPIPLRRPVLVVEDTQPNAPTNTATPPPSGVVASLARTLSASPGKGLEQHRRRRSSSAASMTEGAWNMRSVVVTEPRMQETEVQIAINEEEGEEGEPQQVQIYRFVFMPYVSKGY